MRGKLPAAVNTPPPTRPVDAPSDGPLGPRASARPARAGAVAWVFGGGFLLAAIAAGAALLAGPTRTSRQLPGDAALGTYATQTIKADRDYDIVDPETTAAKRDEAARAVRPVYEYDPQLLEQARHRLGDAFGLMRDAWNEAAPKTAPAPPGSKKALAAQASALAFFQDRRDDFTKALQAVDPVEADFEEFARDRFAEPTERAAGRLLGWSMGEPLIADRALLRAERERGIMVRAVGPQGPQERLVRDVYNIHGLHEVEQELDAKASELAPELAAPLRRAVVGLARSMLRPNVAYDEAETRRRQEDAAAAVKDSILRVRRGEKVIGDGERLEKSHLRFFEAMRAASGPRDVVALRVGAALLALVLTLAAYAFAARNFRRFRPRRRDLVFLASLLVLALAGVRGCDALADWLRDLALERGGLIARVPVEIYVYAFPFAAAAMVARLVVSSEIALVFTVALAPLVGLSHPQPLGTTAFVLLGSLVAADRVANAGTRRQLARAGVWTGLAQAGAAIAFALYRVGPAALDETLAVAFAAYFGGAVVTPLVAAALLPVVEATFGYATNLKLAELASLNHPVLKDLILQAPGTYHHSLLVGALVDAAAAKIGANPLLARVGAYYHDIGKVRGALYFGENQKSENPHDRLVPSASASVLRRHVSDGLEVARDKRLPRPVLDIVEQHHGTRLAGTFLHKARAHAQAMGLPPPDESEFRYPGPLPQSREAALVMIADVCEATAKSLPEPTPARIAAMVQKAVNAIAAEGQLDACDVTMKDLAAVAESFTETLSGIYAPRAAYPSGTPPAPIPLRAVKP